MKPTWQTKDGRVISIREMTDAHLENTIRYLECRGAAAGAMTPEERAIDPVALAEYLLNQVSEFTVEKYKMLLQERERRAYQKNVVQKYMSATRPDGEVALPSAAPPKQPRLMDALRRERR